MSQPERLTDTIHVPLTPSMRAQIDRLAEIEDRKPATVARRLILTALATTATLAAQREDTQ